MRNPPKTVGLWSLDSPGGLLDKMHADYKRMQADPSDPWPAFDFFVTAYHMCEWVANGDEPLRARLESEPLIRVAGAIATRAKHFRADDKRWVRLESTEDRAAGPHRDTPMGLRTPLRISLQDPTCTPLGQSDVTALQVAECLLQRWQRWINTRT